MDRSQKADLVAELKSVFSETSVVVITRNLGLTVAQSTDLRLKMRDAGAQFKVAKNRLALIALEGTRYGPIGDMLTGPTALATSIDPVAAAKVAVDFAKTNDRLEIVGGAMGDTLLDVNGIKALAALPSLDQLRGTLVGLIQAPATKIARIVIEPASLLARVTGAYAAKAAWFFADFSPHDIMGAAPARSFQMADLNKIVEELSTLTVMEAAELSKLLEEKWGVSAAAAVAVAGPAAAAGPAEEEQTEFDVILTGDGGKKINVIKEVRAITQLGLGEAKALVEGAPKPIKEGVNKEEAQKIKAQIEAAGGTVELK